MLVTLTIRERLVPKADGVVSQKFLVWQIGLENKIGELILVKSVKCDRPG